MRSSSASTSNHPERRALWADYYRYGTRWGNSTNVDWVIPDLDRLLVKPDAALSHCLWRSLQALDRSFFFAKFRHAESYPIDPCCLTVGGSACSPAIAGIGAEPGHHEHRSPSARLAASAGPRR